MPGILRHYAARLDAAWLKLRWRQLRPAFAIPSHLTVRERVTLFQLATSATAIAEIGAYVGASACCFGAAVAGRTDRRIVCIDTWQNDAMSEGARDTWAEFSANTAAYSRSIVPVRGFSTDVVGQVAALLPVLDLLFIDGDHSYPGVKADWESYKGLLRPGATVVFHDYGWADGVRRVVSEDLLPKVDRHDALPNMWWGRLRATP